jgi:ParB/RepB/Spo0J family partition protein
MKGTRKTVPLSQLRRHSIRQRQRSREQSLALAESWLAMPVHPIVVRPATGEPPLYDVADGNSRLDGLELLGVAEVEVFVTEAALTDEELDDIGFITAFHREGLDCSEQAEIVIRKRRSGMANKDVAKKLGINEGWASKLYALADCLPEVQLAARAGKIGANEWAMIAKSPDQLHALGAALGGNREKLRQAAKPKDDAPKEKAARVKIPLAVSSDDYDASGIVTVAGLPGDEIDFAAVENLLKEALRSVKEAQKKGWSLKSAMSAWKDTALAS